MSVQSEISRLEAAKAGIKAAIEAKGVTVPAEVTLDGYAAKVGEINNSKASYYSAYNNTDTDGYCELDFGIYSFDLDRIVFSIFLYSEMMISGRTYYILLPKVSNSEFRANSAYSDSILLQKIVTLGTGTGTSEVNWEWNNGKIMMTILDESGTPVTGITVSAYVILT